MIWSPNFTPVKVTNKIGNIEECECDYRQLPGQALFSIHSRGRDPSQIALHDSVVQCSVVLCSVGQCCAVQFGLVLCYVVCSVQCSIVQCGAVWLGLMQYSVVCCKFIVVYSAVQFGVRYCTVVREMHHTIDRTIQQGI